MTSLTHSGMAANNRTYGYDGEGRRALATTTSTGNRKVFVYDALGRMAAEYDEAAPVSTGSISYLSTDHLGSTRAVIGAAGSSPTKAVTWLAESRCLEGSGFATIWMLV